jgi:transcriptional regulator GlxA family with amidase domain
MGYAHTRVKKPDMPMIEIAIETSYEHPAICMRTLKTVYNTTPIKMRKIQQQDAYLSTVSHR